MKNRLMIRLFLCLALIQLVVPLSMIARREFVLRDGAQFKFKVAPVDSYDAFRGRYVALRIDENYVPAIKNEKIKRGQAVFVVINLDAQGFARFSEVTTGRPRRGSYIRANVSNVYNDKIYLDLPIDRYYMEEKSAPLAEKIYQRYSQRDKKDAYVVVRIKDGFVVIESLYVGGQKIEDMVKQGMKNPNRLGLRGIR